MGEWLSSATAGCEEAAGYQQRGPLQRSQMLTDPAFSRCLAGVSSQPVVTPAQRSSFQERRSRVYADREARVCAVLHAGLTCLPRLHLSKLSGPVFETRGSYRIQSFSALAVQEASYSKAARTSAGRTWLDSSVRQSGVIKTELATLRGTQLTERSAGPIHPRVCPFHQWTLDFCSDQWSPVSPETGS